MRDASCGHSKNMHYHFGDSSLETKEGEGIPEQMQRIAKKDKEKKEKNRIQQIISCLMGGII